MTSGKLMSKGSGLGGTAGGTSGGSGGSRGKLKLESTGRRSLSGKAIQGLIAGRGGLSKSVRKVSVEKISKYKKQYLGLTKSQVGILAGKVSGVKIQISHSYRNQKGGGGDSGISIQTGSEQVIAAQQSGATNINATVTQVGPRGSTTSWTGLIKI